MQDVHPDTGVSRRISTLFYVGAAIILLCGIMVFFSTFLGWVKLSNSTGSSTMSITGLDSFHNRWISEYQGRPLFSGWFSLIFGITIILASAIYRNRRKVINIAVSIVFILSAIIATFNIHTISSSVPYEDGSFSSIEGGLILFLVSSIVGIIASIAVVIITDKTLPSENAHSEILSPPSEINM